MDPYSAPGSWNLIKRNWPTLVGAGLGAVAANFAAGKQAYLQAQKDNKKKFVTWSEKPKPSMKPSTYRSRRPRLSFRRRRYSRRPGKSFSGLGKRLVRTSPIFSLSIAAATSNYSVYQPALGSATIGVQTSDLTSAYRLYRIRKVVLHLVPRIDDANSGLVNNYQAYVAAACDPEDTTAATSIGQITAYDNSYQKWITSGDRFTYTFYPKVVNAVGNAGATAYVGSYGSNPWLQLNATGTQIPHQALKIGINLGSSSTVTFDAFFEYHFDVKGVA